MACDLFCGVGPSPGNEGGVVGLVGGVIGGVHKDDVGAFQDGLRESIVFVLVYGVHREGNNTDE